MPDPYAQQPPPQQDPYSVGYIPPMQQNVDPLMAKHLDSSEILERLKKMLLGFEYDDEEDEWKQTMITLGYDKEGNEIKVPEGPLMDAKDIRITIGYLQMFLNPNTFLSQLEEERINDIMWDVNKKLAILFYNLRHKITPAVKDMIWGMIEYPILLGLSRANKKITLDAMSKMQHSIEHIQAAPKTQPQEQKEFKVLGW